MNMDSRQKFMNQTTVWNADSITENRACAGGKEVTRHAGTCQDHWMQKGMSIGWDRE